MEDLKRNMEDEMARMKDEYEKKIKDYQKRVEMLLRLYATKSTESEEDDNEFGDILNHNLYGKKKKKMMPSPMTDHIFALDGLIWVICLM